MPYLILITDPAKWRRTPDVYFRFGSNELQAASLIDLQTSGNRLDVWWCKDATISDAVTELQSKENKRVEVISEDVVRELGILVEKREGEPSPRSAQPLAFSPLKAQQIFQLAEHIRKRNVRHHCNLLEAVCYQAALFLGRF